MTQVAIAKLLGRHQCPRCGHAFNTGHIVRDGYDMPALAPPSTAQVRTCARVCVCMGMSETIPSPLPSLSSALQDCPKGHRDDCPAARGELARRSDDNEATIQRRLEVYRKEIAPVLSFYEERVSKKQSEAVGLEKGEEYLFCMLLPACVSHNGSIHSIAHAQGILCSFQVKKGVKDAPALEAMMTRTERE